MTAPDVGHALARRLRGTQRAAPASSDTPDWTAGALCAQVGDDSMWYSQKGGSSVDAKRICSACDARTECLAFIMALEPASANYRDGIWGGLSPKERERLSLTGWQPGDPTPAVALPYDSRKSRRAGAA